MELKRLFVPEEYGKYLALFKEKKIHFLLFKQTAEINHEIGGLDVLFRTDEDYLAAKRVLLENGFVVYLSEKNEPYKTMLVKYEDRFLFIFHIQRRISWLGIPVLSHTEMFNGLIPSKEDSLLIHSAHVLFENHRIGYEREIFRSVSKPDYKYINKQLNLFSWKTEFYNVINNNLSLAIIIKAHIKRLFKPDFFKLAYFLLKQFFQFFTKRASMKRKGLLVSFDGVNGCGKTTLAKELTEQYNLINKNLSLKANYYYFGWIPFLPTTKILSKLSRKNKIYQKAVEEKTPRFSLKYELFFLLIFFDYLARFLFHVYPKLRKREAVITDRYFYHIYGQYPYSKNSVLLPILIRLFPRPDYSFFVNTNLEKLIKRRTEIPKEQLKAQQERYLILAEKIGMTALIPEGRKAEIQRIYEKIWRKQFIKLKY